MLVSFIIMKGDMPPLFSGAKLIILFFPEYLSAGIFYSIIHFSIFLVWLQKFTPILKSRRGSDSKGRA